MSGAFARGEGLAQVPRTGPRRRRLAALTSGVVGLLLATCAGRPCPGEPLGRGAEAGAVEAEAAVAPHRPALPCQSFATEQGWRWLYPRLQGSSLYAVWGSGRDVFAVGDAGTVLHSDGVAWCHLVTGSTSDLRGVFGFGPDEVIAVGGEGAILRFDGALWRGESGGTTVGLSAVWGADRSHLFAVGSGGVVLFFDGRSWRPQASGTVAHLRAIWGRSPEDVVAVGDEGSVIHYDGVRWSPVAVDVDDGLEAVWVSPEGEVWIAARSEGVWRVLHRGGERWELEALRGERALLGGISGQGQARWAVGRFGVVLRLDGRGVEQVQTGSRAHLYGLWSSPEGELFAVGEHGTVLHYDGAQWRDQSSQPRRGLADGSGYGGGPGLPRGGFHGLWGSGPTDLYVVGAQGTILHFDGARWEPQSSGTEELLRAVWGSGPRDLWAAGDRGTLLHSDGTSWTATPTVISEDLEGLWGSGPADVFAVGGAGAILHFDGEEWRGQISGVTATLHAVWGRGPQQVFAVGHSGTVLRYDGSIWTPLEPVIGRHFFALWGRGAGRDVYLAGRAYGSSFRAETVLRLTERGVEPLGLAGQAVDCLWGDSAGDLFAAGQGGAFHWDGREWTREETGTSEPLRALWGSGASVIGVGSAGIVERRPVVEGAARVGESQGPAQQGRQM